MKRKTDNPTLQTGPPDPSLVGGIPAASMVPETVAGQQTDIDAQSVPPLFTRHATTTRLDQPARTSRGRRVAHRSPSVTPRSFRTISLSSCRHRKANGMFTEAQKTSTDHVGNSGCGQVAVLIRHGLIRHGLFRHGLSRHCRLATLLTAAILTAAIPSLAAAQSAPDASSRNRSKTQQVGQRESAIAMLQQARLAMSQGELEKAEQLISQIEASNVRFDSLLRPFADSPKRARRDLQQLIAARGNGVTKTSVSQHGGQPGRPGASTPLPAVYAAAQGTAWTNESGSAPQMVQNPHVSNGNQSVVAHPLFHARMALAQGQTNAARQWLQRAVEPGTPELSFDSVTRVEQLMRQIEQVGLAMAQNPGPEIVRRQADLWMEQSERLMSYGAHGPALQLAQQAANLPARYAPGEKTPEELLAALSAAPSAPPSTLSPPSLATPSPVAQSLPPVVNSSDLQNSDTGLANAKTESMRLLSQAKMSLDRHDVATANELVERAMALGVPASAYGPNEIQPWALQMEIQREANRGASVVTATVHDDDIALGAVAPSVYRTDQDTSYVRTAAAESSATRLAQFDPPDALPEPEAFEVDGAPLTTEISDGVSGDGAALMEQGTEAIRRGDLSAAREFFRQAWAFEDQLDPESRQRLQDHLQLLNVAGSTPSPRSTRNSVDDAERSVVRDLYQRITREQLAAERTRTKDPKAAWEQIKVLRDQVASANIDEATKQQLLRRVEYTLDDMQRFIDANRAMIELDEQNAAVIREVELRRRLKLERQEQLAKIVEDFNVLMEQRRFSEAVVVAKKGRELDSQNPVVQNMLWKSRFAERMFVEYSLQERSRAGFEGQMDGVRDAAIPFDDRNPIRFPEKLEWEHLTKQRKRLAREVGRPMTEADRDIYNALKQRVKVQFEHRPLAEVVETLGNLAGINIFLDPQGLAAEGVTSDTPVDLSLQNEISLRSALTLVLRQLRLNYVIQDEVLQITSESMRAADVYSDTYPVADLVIPIPNFTPSYYMGLPSAIREGYNMIGYGGAMGGGFSTAPLTVAANQSDTQVSNASVLAQMASAGVIPNSRPTQPIAGGPGGLGGGAQADFDSLINLILDTVAPESWLENGGEGSISEFENNLSLVVRQTEEVHEEIADLLDQLRRLQDLQVTIEVRFITLNDDFFERIGVDFDFDIDDNVVEAPGDDSGPSVTIGIGPDGNPTADLDLQFSQGSFNSAIPAFGSYDAASAANFGFAVLSDIEAFFVIQASTGDNRTNILQAPKVTLFNGQSASISDQAQRPFVTSVIPVVGDFAAAHQPVIAVLAEGTSLGVQAVVSNDRRFVRLTLSPFFSTIEDVDTFTFNGTRRTTSGTAAVDPSDDTQTVSNGAEEVVEGTTVQLPTLAFTTVSTTVSVPDGGTVLLGGIKRLREGRTEAGVPLLNKIPYVSRLFKNVGIGRTAQSLMMMVTPRIIIQEEQEENLGLVVP